MTPLTMRLIGLVAVLSIIAGGYWYIDHRGYTRGKAEVHTVWDADKLGANLPQRNRRQRRGKRKGWQMKKLDKLNSVMRKLALTSLLLSVAFVTSSCATLKLCQGSKVCEWQEVEVRQCQDMPKAPPELLQTLRLQPALDLLLRSGTH